MGLKQLRKQRGLSMEAVGMLAGIDTATVSRIERGLVRPRPDTIVRLARGLGIRATRMKEILAENSDSPAA